MNDSLDAKDPRLEAHFRRAHTHLAAEPFVSATVRRVAAERTRAAVARRALHAAATVAVILASPWLIEGSVFLSEQIRAGFALAAEWVSTPAGAVVATIAFLVIAAASRWWGPSRPG